MKKLLFAILMFWATYASGQTIGRFRYDSTVFERIGGFNKVRIIGNLAVTNLTATADTTYKPLGISSTGIINKLTYWPGSGSGSGGWLNLGTGYGLINVNDSTYRVDTTNLIVNVARLNNFLALKLNIVDSTAGGYYPYSSNPLGYLTSATTPNSIQDGIISGGEVTWVSGLIFDISSTTYRIDGTIYTSPATQITLPASDPTDPRYDLFFLTTGSIVDDVQGTPAPSPAQPVPDPNTLALTYIHIAAGATTPTGITNTQIYDENIEWTGSGNMTGLDFNYPTNPFQGSKSTKATSFTNGQTIKYTNGTVLNITNYQTLKLYIRLNVNFSNSTNLSVIFYNGINAVTPSVNLTSFSFSRTITGSYQVISIPVSAFNFQSSSFDAVVFRGTGSGGLFQLDNIILQTGVTIISNNGVTSFNARTGAVNSIKADYDDWFVDTLYRKPGQDSIFYKINSIERAIKDSIASGGGSTNTNLGAGYRWAVPNTNGIKTAFAGYGVTIDSTSNANGLTFIVDTTLIVPQDQMADLVLGGAYLFAPTPNSIAFDSSLVGISLAKNAGGDSIRLISGSGSVLATVADRSNAGTVTSVTGTANRITSTGGVTPVIDIGTDVITLTGTQTLTNKRWTARVGSTTSSATPTINTDNVDIYKLTAQTEAITSFTTNLSGTPVDGDILEIQVTGTAARAITWGSSFVSSTVTLPATTVTTATLTVILQYYTTSSYGNNKWVCANYY